MPLWQIALAVLVVAWSAQALGTYVQMRHYSDVMGEVTGTWSDGYMGTGNARSALGAGVILMLIVGPDRLVRRVLIMQGRSVFARFKRVEELEGKPLAALDSSPALSSKGSRSALSIALSQVEKAASKETVPAAA